MRQRWSKDKIFAFEQVLAPPGVYLAVARRPIAWSVFEADGSVERFGGNRGAWLARLGTTKARWRDTITTLLNAGQSSRRRSSPRSDAPPTRCRAQLNATKCDMLTHPKILVHANP